MLFRAVDSLRFYINKLTILMIRISNKAKADLTQPNSILKITSKLFLLLFFICTHQSNGQLGIVGDMFIAKNGHMHVETPRTLFVAGTVTADRGDNQEYGLISFGKNSIAERADHNTHVDGFVRSYNTENFSYPTGHNNILQPVHFKSDDDVFLDFAYNHIPHQVLEVENNIDKISDEFYWNIKGDGESRIYLSWNIFSNLDKLTGNELRNLAIA